MKRHGSMNHIFRLVWSHVLNSWVAVAEKTRGRGKGSSRKLVAAALALSSLSLQVAHADQSADIALLQAQVQSLLAAQAAQAAQTAKDAKVASDAIAAQQVQATKDAATAKTAADAQSAAESAATAAAAANVIAVAQALTAAKAATADQVIAAAAATVSANAAQATLSLTSTEHLITKDKTLNGNQNGAGKGGYMVESGTLTINNGTVSNFVTTGGAGSGGGAALGGAIFVGTNGTANLNNVSFLGNKAVGGAGGAGLTGGSLNGVGINSVGSYGVAGRSFYDNETLMGDGVGNGQPGTVGGAGGSGAGIGGAGGVGGVGGKGHDSNPDLDTAAKLANLGEASASIGIVNGAASAAALVIHIAGAAQPFTASEIAGLVAEGVALGLDIAQKGIDLDTAIANLKSANDAVKIWNASLKAGDTGRGGDGGQGGRGADGANYAGGGTGGNGGTAGAGVGISRNGAGGAGGNGGNGDFGAGGGQGGNGATSSYMTGASGSGGVGGFGAGTGASGTGFGMTTSSGGGGGSGFGGAIFVQENAAGTTGGSLTITGNSTFGQNITTGGSTTSNNGAAGGTAGSDLYIMTGASVNLDAGAGNVITFNGTIADDSAPSTASNSNAAGAGADITISSGVVNFNGANTYTGKTIIAGGVLNAKDGVGLNLNSNLDFNNTTTSDGVLQTSGLFNRFVGTGSNRVQWTGSGGFASSSSAGLTVSLNGDAVNGNVPLKWDSDSFVQAGNALVFGSTSAIGTVNFTNAINLNNETATIRVNANLDNTDTATMSGILSNGGLTVDGNGKLILTAANTYTGATTINGGATLLLSGSGSIAASSEVKVNGGLDISSSGASLNTLSGAGTVNLGAQTLTITSGSTSFDGVISDATPGGNLHIAGGQQTLTGTNTYTGSTIIDAAGALALSGNGSIAASSGVQADGVFDISATTGAGATITTLSGASSGAVNLGGQTLTLSNASTTFSGNISGSGNVTLAAGTETLAGENDYSGTTTINAKATLALTGGGSIASSVGVVDNGTFDISATSGASITTLSGSGTVNLGAQTLSLTTASDQFSGIISGAGGLHIQGPAILAPQPQPWPWLWSPVPATVVQIFPSPPILLAAYGYDGQAPNETLSNVNTYTGATTIDTGATLTLTGAGSIATSSGVLDNGSFDISNTSKGAAITTLSGAGMVTLGAQTLSLSQASDTFSGNITGQGNLTLLSGIETLAGINDYTGVTTINGSTTLALTGSGSIASSAGVVDNGAFDISTTSGASITTLSGSGTVNLGAQTLSLTNASDQFSGVISGAGGLHIQGDSMEILGIPEFIKKSSIQSYTEILSGVNTYTGATTIDTGATLMLTGAGNIATSSGVVDNGTFDISATSNGAAITTLSGSGTVTLGAQTLSLSQAGDTFSGSMNGAGGITVMAGNETLSGANSYTGTTTINANATLALTGSGSIAASMEVADNGTFDITNTDSGATITTLSGTGKVTLGAQTLSLSQANDTFSGSIKGTGNITVLAGTETLSGANGYTGTTTINANATLALTGSGKIAASTEVLDNGTFDISSTTAGATITTLSGSGVVNLGGQKLSLSNAGDTFSGSVQGAGGITVMVGAETLSGTNSYTGATVINANATLNLTVNGSIAASSGVLDNGDFDISGTTSGAAITTLSGTGMVNLGAQTLSLSNAKNMFSGIIEGTSGITVLAGTEILSGSSSYTGTTVISTGATLALKDGGSIGGSSGVIDNGIFDIANTTSGATITTLSGTGVVNLGAQTLSLSQANDVFSGSIKGAGNLDLLTGKETLSGSNIYLGTTSIGSGATLALTGTGSIAASTEVLDNGTFDISSTSAGAAITTLSGAGTVALGAQTLSLSKANDTFSGSVQGTGGITVMAGIETLSGVNKYSGASVINANATLALTGSGSIIASSGVLDNGTFDISNTTTLGAIKTLSGAGLVNLGGKILALTEAHDTFSGTISGAGILNLVAGTETLSGANSYTGTTSIYAGATLVLTGAGSIAASSNVIDKGNVDISATAGAAITTLSGSGKLNLGAQTLSITNGSGNFGGVISGSGKLAVTGGTQTLTGINTYTGASSISAGATLALAGIGSIASSAGLADAGTLNIASSNNGATIATLSGNGAVALGNRTLTIANAKDSFSGSISGNGSLAITGGSETLSGINTQLGGTQVSNATLVVNSDMALGAVQGGLKLNNATLSASQDLSSTRAVVLTGSGTIDTAGKNVTLSGVISGGALVATGKGELFLNGVNTYTGGTTINGGAIVAISSDTALGDAAGKLVINDGKLLAEAAFSSARNIEIDSKGELDTSGNTLNLTGQVTVSIGGNAPVVLFTGSAHVTGLMTVTTAGLDVKAGANLRGVGVIATNTIIDGKLQPGNSPGTLTFTAPVTMSSGSTLEIDIDGTGTGTGAGNYSRAIVQGQGNLFTMNGVIQPNLRSITGNASNTYVPAMGQIFDIVHSEAGIVGSAQSLLQPAGLLAGSRFDALYTTNDLQLYVTPADYANLAPFGVALTANQAQVGAALNAMRPTPGVRSDADRTRLLATLYTQAPQDLPADMTRLGPTVYGDALLAGVENSRLFAGAIAEQVSTRRASAGNSDGNSAETAQRPTSWVSGYGQRLNVGVSGGTSFASRANGVAAGVDVQLGNGYLLGGALGHDDGSVDSVDSSGNVKLSTTHAALYGRWSNQSLFVEAQAGMNYADLTARRNLGVFGSSANGKGSSNGVLTALDAGTLFQLGAWQVKPTAGLQYAQVTRGSLNETDAGLLSLNVAKGEFSSLSSKLNVRAETSMDLGDGYQLSPIANMNWWHDLTSGSTTTTAAFSGAPDAQMRIASTRIGASEIGVGLGANLRLPGGVIAYANYAGKFRGNVTSKTLVVGLNMPL